MNSNGGWDLQIDARVHKELRKIPANYIKKIVPAIEALSSDPYGGDLQKIRGEENMWRKRAGEYRIFFEIFQDRRVVNVYHIERRGSKTYR